MLISQPNNHRIFSLATVSYAQEFWISHRKWTNAETSTYLWKRSDSKRVIVHPFTEKCGNIEPNNSQISNNHDQCILMRIQRMKQSIETHFVPFQLYVIHHASEEAFHSKSSFVGEMKKARVAQYTRRNSKFMHRVDYGARGTFHSSPSSVSGFFLVRSVWFSISLPWPVH